MAGAVELFIEAVSKQRPSKFFNDNVGLHERVVTQLEDTILVLSKSSSDKFRENRAKNNNEQFRVNEVFGQILQPL